MFGIGNRYPPVEHRPPGWKPWENEEPQPRARIPWIVLLSSFMCCCMPASGAYLWTATRPQPEPTAIVTVAAVTVVTEIVVVPTNEPTATPIPTQTATNAPTATPSYTPMPTNTAMPTETPSATPTSTITPTFTPTPERGIVSRGRALNLRGGAGTVYEIKATVPLGTTFDIIEVGVDADGAYWYRVVVDSGNRAGATGWLHSDYVEVIR